jgi:hypothetical protein
MGGVEEVIHQLLELFIGVHQAKRHKRMQLGREDQIEGNWFHCTLSQKSIADNRCMVSMSLEACQRAIPRVNLKPA